MTRRVVTFAGSSVRIECDGREAESLVDFLFRDLPADGTPPPHITFEVRGAEPDGALTLRCGDKRLYRGTSVGAAGRMLVERVAYHLSDRSVGGLLLHAAAVGDGGRSLLLPGKTGAGKTTLTAWLVSHGYRYLTDELVYVPAGTNDVVPFSRPLNIRTAGVAALEAEGVALDAPEVERLSAPGLALVRLSPRGNAVTRMTADLAVAVFPSYQSNVAFSATAISKAEAGLNLMACLINARNLTGHGHAEIARLAREVPAFRVTYGDVGSVESWIAGLLPRGAQGEVV